MEGREGGLQPQSPIGSAAYGTCNLTYLLYITKFYIQVSTAQADREVNRGHPSFGI